MSTYEEAVSASISTEAGADRATQNSFPEENILLRYRVEQKTGDRLMPESNVLDLDAYGGAYRFSLRMAGAANGYTQWVTGGVVGDRCASCSGRVTETTTYSLSNTVTSLPAGSGFCGIGSAFGTILTPYEPISCSFWVQGDWDSIFAETRPVCLFHYGNLSTSDLSASNTATSLFSIVIYSGDLRVSYRYSTAPTSSPPLYTINVPQVNTGLNSGWNNIVVTFGSNKVCLYVNGEEVGSLLHSPGYFYNVGDRTIVAGFGEVGIYSSEVVTVVYPHFAFTGKLDDLTIWNKALLPSEVLGVYNSINYDLYVSETASIDSVSTYGIEYIVALAEELIGQALIAFSFSAGVEDGFLVAPGIGYVQGAESSEIIYEWLSDRVDAIPSLSSLYVFFMQAEEIIFASESGLDQQQLHDLVSEIVNLYAVLDFTDAPAANEVISVAETIAAGGSLYNLAGAENLSVAARLLGAWLAILLESIELDAVPEWRVEYLLGLVERLAVTGSLSSQLEAEVLASTALAFSELTLGGKGADAEDEIIALAILLDRVFANNALIETATLLGTTTLEGRLVFSVSDAVISAGVPTSTALVREALEAGVAFAVNFGIGGQTYSGWVMNTKNFALSEYQNFPFNSFAKVGTQYYAASETGLYLLDGSTDAGEDVQATITLGAMDFTGERKTNVCEAFLALRNDGEIAIKIKTDDNNERWYRMSQESDVLRDRREKFARGVTSRFWTFSLENIDGADFEVHEMTFLPLVMKRRI